MKLANGILGMTLALAFSGLNAAAQLAPSTPKSSSDSVRTFYLTNVSQADDVKEITTALRNLLDPNDKIFLVPSQNAIIMRAAPEQLLLAQKLLGDLDRLRKTYRLTYTVTESDSGKRVGAQHFTMIVVSGASSLLKQGSRVPVATGTYNSGSSASQTQFTYLDVGLNIQASVDEYYAEGVKLRTKMEQSAIAEEKSGVGTQDPIVRQTLLEGTSILTQGKPLMLGSLDIPGSTRHLDVEVMLEFVR